jgi:hypothetical protein
VPLLAPQQTFSAGVPDRLIMAVSGLSEQEARQLAQDAVFRARQRMPRVSGATASRLEPFYGKNFFGIWFPDSHTWFMERGTGPRTMRSLAGKTIPMWVDDPSGEERAKNPKAQTRTTEDGRHQILIFRKAAKTGQRRTNRKVNKVTGAITTWTTPMSYPGAPGRIGRRAPGAPYTPIGNVGGGIMAGNSGVKWRHPGIRSMQFLNSAIADTAFDAGMIIETVFAVDSATWQSVTSTRKVGA